MLKQVDGAAAPAEEYAYEARVVLPHLLVIKSRDSVVQVLAGVFTAIPPGPGLADRLNALADRLYEEVVLPASEQNESG
jgi:hypothetical protein